ncbi:MAG: type II secretion system F family protein [bacterium]
MQFNYQARTKTGEIRTGSVEASSKEATIALLQKHGLYVTFLEERKFPLYAKKLQIFGGVSRKDVVLFSRQLSIMFKSKVPLIESLRVLSIQAENTDFREKILRLSEDVEGGTLFSKALSSYPKIFSPFYVAMVKSGEASGKLSEVSDYLAEHLEREYHLTAKVKGALIYPLLILFVVILVLALMIFFVVPNLANILVTNDTPLPFVTRMVISSSEFLRHWFWMIGLFFGISIFAIFRYYSTKKGKIFFDKFSLRLPFVGPLSKMIYLSRFAENLSTLISGGLPIAQALETVGNIISNNSYKEVVLKARDEVRKGVPISSVLSGYPEILPPIFVQMTLVGEKTGTLDTTLMNIVDFYRKEIDRSIDNIMSIMEPALILFLGLIVAGLMLSILMPLYSMITI